MKQWKPTRRQALFLNGADVGLWIDTGPNYGNVNRFRFFESNEDFYSGKHIFEAKGIKQAEIFLLGYREAVVRARDNGEGFEDCNLFQVK